MAHTSKKKACDPHLAALFNQKEQIVAEPATPGLDSLRDLLKGVKKPEAIARPSRIDALGFTQRKTKKPMKHWRGPIAVEEEDPVKDELLAKRQSIILGHCVSPKAMQKAPKGIGYTSSLDPDGQVRSNVLTPRALKSSVESVVPLPILKTAALETNEFNEHNEKKNYEPPIAKSVTVLKNWISSFSQEESEFGSISVFFETRLREALIQTSAAGMILPNRARAAVCCDLLLKLPKVFGRYDPLVSKLVREVLCCIYQDYDVLEASYKNQNMDARIFFEATAFFDQTLALRKRAAMLQSELKESSDGAGLVKLFRERFLLWDGRNLLLRSILFRGWRTYSRKMTIGRQNLKLTRLQYWFNRLWDSIEIQKEEKIQQLDSNVASLLGDPSGLDDNLNDVVDQITNDHETSSIMSDDESKPMQRNNSMRKLSRRFSSASHLSKSRSSFCDNGSHTGGSTSQSIKASELALKFLGLAQNRAHLLQALDEQYVASPTYEKNKIPIHTILSTIISLMESSEDTEMTIHHCLSRNIDFAARLKLCDPPLDDNQDEENEIVIDSPIDYMDWLGFGTLNKGKYASYALQRWRQLVKEISKHCTLHTDQSRLLATINANHISKTEESNTVSTQTDFEHTKSPVLALQYASPKPQRSKSNGAAIKDKDAMSRVAIASVCQLIPLVYDRLLEVFDGSEAEVGKVKISEIAKLALVRRFGVRNIAANYYNSLMRTVTLCPDREQRIELFCLVFSIGSTSSDTEQALVPSYEQKQRSTPSSRRRSNYKPQTCGVISLFAQLWHTYFRALQIVENTKVRAPAAVIRKQIRESKLMKKSRAYKKVHKSAESKKNRFNAFVQQLRKSEVPTVDVQRQTTAVEILKLMDEFRTAEAEDIATLVSQTFEYECPLDVDTVLVKQGDASQPPILILGLEGEVSVYVKASTLIEDRHGSDGATHPVHGELVKKMRAPFIVGEGRLLSGMQASATIVTSGKTRLLVCGLDAFENLLDAGNSALGCLEKASLKRAEERVRATGTSVSRERIAIYRQFFCDVDVTRTGRVTLQEVLDALRSRDTKISLRDVERAFLAADKDGDLELNFDEFIKMCDSLVRRGKRIFEKGTVSDILRNVQSSYVLYDALVYAVEHCFKHAAMHAPAKYAALLAALNNLEKIKTKDITSFLGASTNVPSAMISQTFVVVDADQAMLTAMQFWEIEYQCQNKLIATARARFTIGAFIHRWLSERRERIAEREAWTSFLEINMRVSAQLHGVISYNDFVEIVEEAYGATISDALRASLFNEFEDLASKMTCNSSEATIHAKQILGQHVAAIRIQLAILRHRIDKAEVSNVQKRATLLVLLSVAKNVHSLLGPALAAVGVDSIVNGLPVHVGHRIAQLLLAVRSPQVNEQATFFAMRNFGLRLGAGSSASHHARMK